MTIIKKLRRTARTPIMKTELDIRKVSYAIPGAPSLFTTPEDLAKWSIIFDKHTVGTPEMIRKMETKGVLNNGDSTSYGLGLAIDNYNGLYKVGYGGTDAGYRTQISRFPNENFAVIVFGNESSFSASRITNQITDLYLSEKFVVQKQAELPKKKSNVKVSKELLASYVGDYDIRAGVKISITNEDGKLYGELTGQEKFGLIPETNSKFQIEGSKSKLSFH